MTNDDRDPADGDDGVAVFAADGSVFLVPRHELERFRVGGARADAYASILAEGDAPGFEYHDPADDVVAVPMVAGRPHAELARRGRRR